MVPVAEFINRSAGFLGAPRTALHDGAVLIDAPYFIEHFDLSLFEQLAITAPDRIRSSVRKRQAEFLAGRCMAFLAQAALGLTPQQIPAGQDRAPIWPDGVLGSISHTKRHCACFLSSTPGVQPAVDIEQVVTDEKLKALYGVVLSASDQLALAASGLPPLHAATLGFSAKETLFKALYPTVRRYFGFDYAEILTPQSHKSMTLELLKPLGPHFAPGDRFEVAFEIENSLVITRLLN